MVGPTVFVTMRVPAVRRSYPLELGLRADAIEVEAGVPPRSYLWVQLDGALRELGGRRQQPSSYFLGCVERVDAASLPCTLVVWLGRVTSSSGPCAQRGSGPS